MKNQSAKPTGKKKQPSNQKEEKKIQRYEDMDIERALKAIEIANSLSK